MGNLSFLKANRFWVLVLYAVVLLLANYGILPLEVSMPLEAACLGFIGVRTVDRLGEYSGKKK